MIIDKDHGELTITNIRLDDEEVADLIEGLETLLKYSHPCFLEKHEEIAVVRAFYEGLVEEVKGETEEIGI